MKIYNLYKKRIYFSKLATQGIASFSVFCKNSAADLMMLVKKEGCEKNETDNLVIPVETIDYGYFKTLLKVLSSPYVVMEGYSGYPVLTKQDEHVLETFSETF